MVIGTDRHFQPYSSYIVTKRLYKEDHLDSYNDLTGVTTDLDSCLDTSTDLKGDTGVRDSYTRQF